MSRRIGLAALAAAALLSACGSLEQEGSFEPTLEAAKARLTQADPDPAVARANVTPALVNALPSSVSFFEAVDPEVKAAGLLIHSITSDPGRWNSLQGEVAFILKGGLPLRTHGLGFGLHAANVDPTLAALASRHPQQLTREMRFLDGQHHEIIRSFSCDFAPEGVEEITVFGRSHTTHRFVERCADAQAGFENRYWLGGDGVIWRSETWLAPRFGLLRLERLSVVP